MPRSSTVANKAFLTAARNYAETCRKVNRELLPHLSTANVARDLDLLRAAVGDAKLNYIGLSYGSVIGATYASLFPGRTRAMVLDSPIDVQGYYDNPVKQWREHAAGHEHVLDRFLTACRDSQGRCGFGGSDPAAALDALLARLDQAPIRSSDPSDARTLNGDIIRRVFEWQLRTRALWPAVAEALAKAEAGDGRIAQRAPVPALLVSERALGSGSRRLAGQRSRRVSRQDSQSGESGADSRGRRDA